MSLRELKGIKNNSCLALEKYTTSGKDAIICLSSDEKCLNEKVEELAQKNRASEQEIMLRKALAEESLKIDEANLRSGVLKLIKNYWETCVGWDDVEHVGKSRKKAYQIYMENCTNKGTSSH